MMEELIARLEKASGPDRELDCLIAAAVEADVGLPPELPVSKYLAAYGIEKLVESAESYNSILRTNLLRYTASLDAAMTLAKSLAGIVDITISIEPDMPGVFPATTIRWYPRGKAGSDWRAEVAGAPTPELALCIASLKARSDGN